MTFNKIDHPANFVFVASKRNPYAIGKRSFDFRKRDLGEDVYRLEVRSRIWKRTPTLSAPDDHAFKRTKSADAGQEQSKLVVDGSAEISLLAHGDAVLESCAGKSFGVLGQKWVFRFRREKDMLFYGMGEKSGPIEKSGFRTTFWNTDLFADFPMSEILHGNPDPLYVSIPYLLIRRGRDYVGILVDTSYPVFVNTGSGEHVEQDVGATTDREELYIGAVGDMPVLYFIYGRSALEVTAKLQRLCGATPLPPLWALGHHQSRWGFNSFDDLEEVERGFARHRIPNDGVWLDIDYMQGYRVFSVDGARFPDAKARLAAFRARGTRVVAILDPGVKVDTSFPVYKDGASRDVFCKTSENQEYVGFVWPGATVFPDFSLPETRQWWADRVRTLKALGLAGFWLDMNDPSTGSSALDEMRFGKGKQAHESFHNHYALGMQIASREGLEAESPGERPFLISRSASTGSSRFCGVWLGDNVSSYHHLAQSLPMALNMSLSGIPFVGADVPGFSGDADAALAAAWYKAAFLLPFLRNHSHIGTRRQEPWAFDRKTTRVIAHYIALRYKFLPYLYSLFVEHEEHGFPVLRPVFMEFEDAQGLERIDDQFMIGPFLMQAPIVREQRNTRRVTLPEGRWWSPWDRRWLKGGRSMTVVESARTTPLFFREGAVIPMQVGERETNENDLLNIELHLFVSERYDGVSSFVYHADDGETLDYRSGKRTSVAFTVKRDSKNIIVETRTIASGFGPLAVRFFVYGFFGAILLKRGGAGDEVEALPLRSTSWMLAGTKVAPHTTESVTLGEAGAL